MKKIVIAPVVMAALINLAPIVYADPGGYGGAGFDPHFPNSQEGFCPGGGWGGALNFGNGYCDGIKYPDGSYWHQVRGSLPFLGPSIQLSCVVNDGSMIPPPAPRGGCGGAV